ncbi:MAG: ABC transporter substrate-binding protein [Rhodobacteraceae bacterium]|jgi:putative thiamine transport system substrate-binding protein|nr:ABC transporter substrate-binding protein [Paracoccaceae bacterium]
MPSPLARLAAAALIAAAPVAQAQSPDPADWSGVLEEARGQTVFWHAWGGSPTVNDFIAWVGDEVQDRYGVTLEHVKLTDTGEAVSRVIAEHAAGQDTGGAVDLIWINGENFAALQSRGLLQDPWVTELPNWRFIDPEANPATVTDFTLPTNGQEAPWGLAQVVFPYDAARVETPPRSMAALLDWARENPGRFAFPQPPDFLGHTFLKQALSELAPDPAALQAPVDDATYDAITAPLWDFMDALTPHLWRGGAAYPTSGPQLFQLMADGEIDIAISFSPNEASNLIANVTLQDSVRTFVMEAGSLGNASFVAIPYNANAAAGAMVVADFLMSPEAQAEMANPEVWGVGTVLAMDRLSAEDRARFDDLPLGIATLPAEALGAILPEPHPSWVERLEADWTARYGTAQ